MTEVGRSRGILLRVPTAFLLVATNLVPLAGVAFAGWHLGTVMVLYWLENGIIGLVTAARMLLRTFAPLPDTPQRPDGPLAPATPGSTGPAPTSSTGQVAGNLAMIGFFLMHYGVFWVVHGVFVIAFFGGAIPLAAGTPGVTPIGTTGIDEAAVATGLVALALYHLVSFLYWDVRRGESRSMTMDQLMMAPYPRLFILHITIILGAFVVASTGQPIAALAFLVLLKTALDLGAHLRGKGFLGGRQPVVVVGGRVIRS